MTDQISPAASMLLSLATCGVLVLAWGGVQMLRRGERQKGVLMLVCAVVVLGNVLIWAL